MALKPRHTVYGLWQMDVGDRRRELSEVLVLASTDTSADVPHKVCDWHG
jgi:hypothetical protein